MKKAKVTPRKATVKKPVSPKSKKPVEHSPDKPGPVLQEVVAKNSPYLLITEGRLELHGMDPLKGIMLMSASADVLAADIRKAVKNG